MRITFTSFAYYPELSGVPIVVEYLAEGLAKYGHSVTVVTRVNGLSLPERECINGVSVVRFNIGQTITKKDIGDISGYIDFVVNSPKDVLVLECLQCQTTDLLLPYLSGIKCKIIIHSHGAPGILMKPFNWEGDLLHSVGHFHNWLRWKKYYRWTFPKYANGIDAAICLSLCASDMDYLSNTVGPVYIAENAANDLFFQEARSKMDIPSFLGIKNKKYILNISNYSERKNQIQLIKAFEKAGLCEVSLVLIGSQKNSYYYKTKRKAEKVCKRNGLDVVLLQGVERELFPAIIKNSTLFVMTSKWEEYPVSLVESMAVGTPFLSTLVGNAHILPGGITARCNREIPSLLKSLVNNGLILSRLSRYGRDYAWENNRQDVVIRNYEHILKGVLGL